MQSNPFITVECHVISHGETHVEVVQVKKEHIRSTYHYLLQNKILNSPEVMSKEDLLDRCIYEWLNKKEFNSDFYSNLKVLDKRENNKKLEYLYDYTQEDLEVIFGA